MEQTFDFDVETLGEEPSFEIGETSVPEVDVVVDNTIPDIDGGPLFGASTHPELAGRSLPDQHPTSAITGLDDALSQKQPKGDYALKSELPVVPTKVSSFENDAGYLTEHQDISGLATKEELDTKQDIIPDLDVIRSNANKGASAVQPATLNDYTSTLTAQIDENTDAIVKTKNELNNGILGVQSDLDKVEEKVSGIEEKIPSTASSTNTLADKAFVNSSIASATATFKGTYNTLNELKSVSADQNDYGFVKETDTVGNTVYNRYKYTGSEWVFEYALNNSSFTSEQWASINSGATQSNISQIAQNTTAISDLDDDAVHKDGDETIAGVKTFLTRPKFGAPYDKRLPDGYTELSFLRVNGGIDGSYKNYIDTGVVPDGTIEFDVMYSYENLGPGVAMGQGVILGSRISSTSWVCSVSGFQTFPTGYFGFNNNERRQAYLTQGLNKISLRTPEGRPDVAVYTSTNDSLGTNSYEVTRGTYPANLPTFYLGALHDNSFAGGASENLNGRIYYAKIWKGGVLVRDFVPCVDTERNIVGMYDLANNKMYANAGEADFTAGVPFEDEFAVKTDLTSLNLRVAEAELAVSKKQDIIADLGTIRYGANRGSTAVQPATIQTLSATASITVADGYIYNGGEQTALTIALPTSYKVSFLTEINFTSGATATTLTYPNTIKWIGDDVSNNVFTPVANKRYTIIGYYDGVNFVFVVKGVV